MFLYFKLAGYASVAVVLWFIYGWGSQIIENYGEMQAKITKLERDNALINSRVESYQTLLARNKAAIAQSSCKDKIEYLIKNPDLLKPVDPFTPNNGG